MAGLQRGRRCVPLRSYGSGYTVVMSAVSSPPEIVLASASPRRKKLLEDLGLSFRIVPAEIDETPLPGESGATLAARLSSAKARVIAERFSAALVIAADTVVALDGQLLDKPADVAENEEFLMLLSGREHQVITSHTLVLQGREESAAPVTKVRFRELSLAEMRRYAAGSEGWDKAGGYALQGEGAALVERVCGCYTNVIGLSLPTVIALLERLGVSIVEPL